MSPSVIQFPRTAPVVPDASFPTAPEQRGLPRFDFYPRDWLTGTRELSPGARGVYIDLLAVMYDRGGSLNLDEKWLCKLIGLRDARQLRPYLQELLDAGKIAIEDGRISNRRAANEIAKAHVHIANGHLGGRPKKPDAAPLVSPCSPSDGLSGGDLVATRYPTSYPVPDASFEENQALGKNPPSPSPSPYKKEEERGVAETAPDPLPEPDIQVVEAKSEKPKKAAVTKGSRLPDDWTLPPEWEAEAFELGLSPEETKREAMKFHGYWAAKSGADARKANWKLTWRNWCLKAVEYREERARPQRVVNGRYQSHAAGEEPWRTNPSAYNDIRNPPPWPDAPRGQRCGRWYKTSTCWAMT